MPHRYRLWLIGTALLLAVGALGVLVVGVDPAPLVAVLGPLLGVLGVPATLGEHEMIPALVAVIGLLVPALVDAALVERARRDPSRSGLSDDHVDPLALARRSTRPRRRRARVEDDTARSRPPGPGVQAVALAIIAAACASASQGCGGSAYRHHATAVVSLAAAHTVAHGLADGARTAALDAVEAEHPPGTEGRTEALTAEHARWQPIAHTLDATRAALGVYVEALDAARLSDAGEEDLLALLMPVLRRVSALYAAVAASLRALGVEAPALPPIVETLLGGAL